MACGDGYLEVVKLLVSLEADISCTNKVLDENEVLAI